MAIPLVILFTVVIATTTQSKITNNHIATALGDVNAYDVGEEDNNATCKLEILNSDIGSFRHFVFYQDLNYVYLNLTPGENVTINKGNHIVGETVWVWTFYGKSGALQFLSWPIEFGIWSLRLLSTYVYGPMTIHLKRASGDCSNITVGEIESDMVIGRALTNLTTIFFPFGESYKEKYGPSFYCYKRRMYINPTPLYMLCKHVVCPIEALKYTCVRYFFNVKKGHRMIIKKEQDFDYDVLWWVLPSIVAFILFAFFPLLLVNICWRFSRKAVVAIDRHSIPQNEVMEAQLAERIVWLDGRYHVTLFNTIFGPIISIVANCQQGCSRLVRFLVPFLSLTVIALQMILDYCYLYPFVMTSIDSGVPLGFRSMIAGFEKSSENFLPYLKGPYVALGVYLFITCVFAVIPKSLSALLEKGLCDNTAHNIESPLRLPLRMIERLGSVPIRGRSGYLKLYSVYLGQFYMLFNIRFWKEAAAIQSERWERFANYKILYLIFPLYIGVCFLELLISFLLYCLPILSFGVTVIRAYASLLLGVNRHHRQNIIRKILCCLFFCCLVIGDIFFIWMFCTIFLDATLFVTRIFIFTFTGIIMYPKVSYGYLIFTFTVIFYFFDCIRKFSLTYHTLLKDTIYTCQRLLPVNEASQILVVKRDFKGIKESLYEHVIETHCPRRKQVFVSLLKLGVILGIIGVSIDLLHKTDRFRELHITMHVGTALFTCALPQILKSMCSGIEDKYQRRLFKRELKKTVSDYIGCIVNSSREADDDDEESDGELIPVV